MLISAVCRLLQGLRSVSDAPFRHHFNRRYLTRSIRQSNVLLAQTKMWDTMWNVPHGRRQGPLQPELMSMWDPNALSAWQHDDDLVSWRSLDTIRGIDVDPFNADTLSDEGHCDTISEASDELPEVIEQNSVNTTAFKRINAPIASIRLSGGGASGENVGRIEPRAQEHTTRIPQQNESISRTQDAKRLRGHEEDHHHLRELPSTSEMVSIQDPAPIVPRPAFVPAPNISRGPPSPPAWQQRNQKSPSYDHSTRFQSEVQLSALQPPLEPPRSQIDAFSQPIGQAWMPPDRDILTEREEHWALPGAVLSGAARRVTMTLSDYMAKKKEPVVATLGESESKRPGQDRAYQELEQRYTELEERERRLQDVATKQMHQLEQLTDEIHQKEVQARTLQGEQISWKDKTSQLERQVTQLQTALREKELTVDQNTQIMQQKNTEFGALEKKIQSLQTANESYQDQARKAIEEKDKVHKDYLQVVYELGKIQKQMNATAKETVSIAEKDFLLREIDQLRREKDQLVEKLKDTESKRMSAVQSSSVVESQRVRELQNRVRDLEDELRVLRSNKTSGSQPTLHHSSSLPPPAPSYAASNGLSTARGTNPMDYSPSYSFESAVEYGGSRAGNSSMDSYAMPSLLQGVGTSQQSKPKTLKDMLQEKQSDRAPTQQLWQSTDSGIPSLASLGYSSLNRFDASSQPKSVLNMYGSYDEVSRASSSVSTIGDLLRHQATGNQSSPFSDTMNTVPVDPTISAPFATEKQTFLHDAMQKRDLEQKLLKLHVDKEQTEAKLTKVEQSGLKTMSARTEKAWLESRVRELTTEISRIKLSLR